MCGVAVLQKKFLQRFQLGGKQTRRAFLRGTIDQRFDKIYFVALWAERVPTRVVASEGLLPMNCCAEVCVKHSAVKTSTVMYK